MENNVVSEYLLGIEIDGVKQGVVKVANPSPQTIELDLASFEVLRLKHCSQSTIAKRAHKTKPTKSGRKTKVCLKSMA